MALLVGKALQKSNLFIKHFEAIADFLNQYEKGLRFFE